MNNLFLNRYPYTDFHELNLSWIIEMLSQVEKTLNDFVSINALKYADPIGWNITSQYEKNTIVIDPVSGVAYISVQPVPAGVALTNTDYWTVVFDLGQFVIRASKNFSVHYEADTTTTATFASTANDWLVWGDTLYKALVNITPGDTYVVNGNIQHFTMEELVGHLDDLTTADKTSIVNAINELVSTIGGLDSKVGDLDDLDTADKTTIVNAINEVVAIIGDLANLTTPVNTSIVDSINSLDTIKANKAEIIVVINALENGCVNDGVTDNSTIISALINDAPINSTLYFPKGVYYIGSPINVNKTLRIMGDGGNGYDAGTIFKCGGDGIYINASGCELQDFKVLADSHASVGVGIYQSWTHLSFITVDDAPTTKYFDASFDCGNVAHGFWNETIENCAVNTYHDDGLNHQSKMLGDGFKFIGAVNSLISNCWVNHKNIGIHCPPTITSDGYYVDGLSIDNLNVVWSNYGLYCDESRSVYLSDTIIDQCNHGMYLNKSLTVHFSNLHVGQNNEGFGSDLIQFDYSAKIVMDNCDIHGQGATNAISIGASNDIEINDTFINAVTHGVLVNNACGNITGKNLYCNSVDYGVVAYSITFIENVQYATSANYSALAFADKHAETVSGTVADLGTSNYYGFNVSTQYNKKPDNIVFTITKNDALLPIDVIYRKSGTGLGGPSILLFKSDGTAFANESIEYECTCIYN